MPIRTEPRWESFASGNRWSGRPADPAIVHLDITRTGRPRFAQAKERGAHRLMFSDFELDRECSSGYVCARLFRAWCHS